MLTGTGQVTSCVPTLEPFCTWVSWCLLNSDQAHSFHFVRRSSLSGAFPVCLLISPGWPPSSSRPKVMLENGSVDPWRLVSVRSPSVAALTLPQEVAVSTSGETVGQTTWLPLVPVSPGVQSCRKGGQRHTPVSFSLCDPHGGVWSR